MKLNKLLLLFSLFALSVNGLYSQYYDTSAMRIIHLNGTAGEGDMYLDTINNVYRIGMTNGKLGYISPMNFIDSIKVKDDSLLLLHYIDGTTDTADIALADNNGWKIKGNDVIDDTQDYLGTNTLQDLVFKTNGNEALRINDTGDVVVANYPNTRFNSKTDHLNELFTNDDGQLQSASREIIPPTAFLNAVSVSAGNTFNYYNYYAARLNLAGLTPIPLTNLEFYVFSFDPLVFNNVTISATGELTYDVIDTSPTKTFIDVRFFTK